MTAPHDHETRRAGGGRVVGRVVVTGAAYLGSERGAAAHDRLRARNAHRHHHRIRLVLAAIRARHTVDGGPGIVHDHTIDTLAA